MKIDLNTYYTKYAPMVYRRCLYILKNEEGALDIMQDVFVNLIRFQSKLKPIAPSSLLYTMATNLCLNHLRARKLRNHNNIEDFEPVYESPDGNITHARHFLNRLFDIEDDRTKTIAWLHYVDGLTLKETAQQVGMSVSGIRQRLRKLQVLGQSLKET